MERDTSSQGSGLSVAGLILLAVAFVVTFMLKQLIFGVILAVVATILSSAGYMETRRTGGQIKLALVILLISLAGTIIHIAWIVSGPSTGKGGAETEILLDTLDKGKGEDQDKGKIMKELEEKVEELEDGG